MGERGPQTRGPREIEDFVGWEMQGREMGCMGDEGPSTIRNRSSRRNHVASAPVDQDMVAAMALALLRLLLVPLDAVGPSRPRRALRRLSLRFRAPAEFAEF